MKKICTLMLVLFLIFTCSACSSKKATAKKENKTQTDLKEATSKSLVVYFSWSGNTQNVAKEIQKQTNSDIFEIVPEVAYSDDYDTVVDDAKKEQQENARPKIKNKIENIDDYETIYVGYPNWWGDMPMILYTFFDD
ncbi:MAG: NAD(P)H-dependent oxidoreductase, partial [Coprobacillus sp.]|nr:NAD(P)H-dependent oxidoreductase [Coprobacillus sp.]